MRGLLERELPIAIAAVGPGTRAIDVGANAGLYTYALSRTGASVEAFEPQAAWVRVLDAFASARPNVRVHQVALGDSRRNEMLHIPVNDGRARTGHASLRRPAAAARTESVEVRPLDDFGFGDVALIKIDVEGAELGVIGGALETIARHRPLLLVEIEQRHHDRDIGEVFSMFRELRYLGHFLDERGRLTPIERFDVQRHQLAPLAGESAGPYVNNFLFEGCEASARRWPR